ncbi:hypothetical protein LOKO_02492 [Halomonas chromatireducens]|uniref:Uncharacterized protein n=1 Tax=Halomonas chromatireducens TaxID=507626 RepID=A0A125R0A2_9GAMM|nr:hypothetical protein LOKO_02492 [Halomonas chromatireducens]
MATMPDSLLENAMDEISEHALVLQKLGLRLLDIDSETANTALAVAHELWEIQTNLGDGRQVKFDTWPRKL